MEPSPVFTCPCLVSSAAWGPLFLDCLSPASSSHISVSVLLSFLIRDVGITQLAMSPSTPCSENGAAAHPAIGSQTLELFSTPLSPTPSALPSNCFQNLTCLPSSAANLTPLCILTTS